jgi:hypothetical protein
MGRSVVLLSLAPVLITLAACSGAAKSAFKQALRSSTDAPPKIGVFQDLKYHGCSLTLQLPEDDESHKERYIFEADLEGNGHMNIDGRDVDLKLVSEAKAGFEAKVGDRFSETYSGGNLSVRIDYVVKEKGYEGWRYSATITVDRNGAKAQVKTAGGAGC